MATVQYDIKEFNKKSYTELLVKLALKEIPEDTLIIGNLTFKRDTGVYNYVNGYSVLNVFVNKLLDEYTHKEYSHIQLCHWLDRKKGFADTYAVAKQEVLKSDKDQVIYTDGIKVKRCSWDEWY